MLVNIQVTHKTKQLKCTKRSIAYERQANKCILKMGNVSTNEHRQNKQRHHIPDIKFYHERNKTAKGRQTKGERTKKREKTGWKKENNDSREYSIVNMTL